MRLISLPSIGIAEVAAHRVVENDDLYAPMLRGWNSYMRALGDAYPDYCINVNEVLGWGGATSVVYADGAGTVKIGIQHGWVYVPTINSRVLDPDGTYLHSTDLRFLWSILAHGGLFGSEYEIDDIGTRKPCVWVTGNAPEKPPRATRPEDTSGTGTGSRS